MSPSSKQISSAHETLALRRFAGTNASVSLVSTSVFDFRCKRWTRIRRFYFVRRIRLRLSIADRTMMASNKIEILTGICHEPSFDTR